MHQFGELWSTKRGKNSTEFRPTQNKLQTLISRVLTAMPQKSLQLFENDQGLVTHTPQTIGLSKQFVKKLKCEKWPEIPSILAYIVESV